MLTVRVLLQEPQVLAPNLTDYYESLRNNVMSLLEHVRIPNGSGPLGGALGGALGGPGLAPSLAAQATRGAPSDVRDIPPHFDSYLSKLQTLCEEGAAVGPNAVAMPMGSVVAPMMSPSPSRTLYGAVRSTLPTPI